MEELSSMITQMKITRDRLAKEFELEKLSLEIKIEKVKKEHEAESAKIAEIRGHRRIMDGEIQKLKNENFYLQGQIENLHREIGQVKSTMAAENDAFRWAEEDRKQKEWMEAQRKIQLAREQENQRKMLELQEKQRKRMLLQQEMQEVERLKMQKEMRERRRKKHEERRLAELRDLIKQAELQREALHMMRELDRAEAEQAKIDMEAQDLAAKMKRMQELQEMIDKAEARIEEEENLSLDVTNPDWSKPFAVKIVATRMELSLAPGIDVKTAPASTFDNQNFLQFSSGSNFSGTLRPVPFARGGFRYAFYARGDGGEKYILKHMIDICKVESDEMMDLRESAAVHFLGRLVVEEFNKVKPPSAPRFEMITCEVLEWTSRPDSLTSVS